MSGMIPMRLQAAIEASAQEDDDAAPISRVLSDGPLEDQAKTLGSA